ncbi:MAG: cytochrome c3 family protein [Acidobacteriota bacterium]
MSKNNGEAESGRLVEAEVSIARRRVPASWYNRLKALFILALGVAFALGVPGQTPAPKDYSKFTHQSHLGSVKIPGTANTRQLKCDSCHDRSEARSTIVQNTFRNHKLGLSFPGHRACVQCHVAQFTAQPLATCNICHSSEKGLTTRPPQRDFPARYDYNVFFDTKQHEAHVGYKYADGKRLDCAACHEATQKKLARLIPSHPECYVCHTPSSHDEKARARSGCIVCHTQPVARVEARDYRSLAYGARFSHDTHVGYVSGDCSACHTITGGYNRPSGRPGTIRVKQHSTERERTGKGCFSCHDGGSHYGRTIFSGDYGPAGQGSCTKCHGDELKVIPATG